MNQVHGERGRDPRKKKKHQVSNEEEEGPVMARRMNWKRARYRGSRLIRLFGGDDLFEHLRHFTSTNQRSDEPDRHAEIGALKITKNGKIHADYVSLGPEHRSA